MSDVFFNVRIDETLNEQLAKIAAEEGRSKNKQIEYILKQYVKDYLRSHDIAEIDPSQNEST
ncbi:MAG: Arc family DNA-binding protein [Oscillospiraceae bacterium]|nr:Arc family DNA-binding protein [Oscillospiraceae bacterium]